jgi:hypothetical protein
MPNIDCNLPCWCTYGSILITKYCSDDQIKKTEMSRACSTYEVEERFWWERLREGDHLEDLSVDGMIILKWIFEKWDGTWTRLICLRTGTGGRLL